MKLKDKEKAVIKFFKEAFCVDGDVKVVLPNNFKIRTVVELNDSKRGKFFIGTLEEIK